MKVTIFGAGYVGLVTGACLSDIGNEVVCIDIDSNKVRHLNQGILPIYEPGLLPLVITNLQSGRLTFTTDVGLAVHHGEVLIIAVGTPSDEDGSADLQYVLAVANSIGQSMSGFKVVVNKSTAPVGTAVLVERELNSALVSRDFLPSNELRTLHGQPTFAVTSNPEFLKEGAAVDDFMRPDRIILGTGSDSLGGLALQMLKRLYSPFNRNHDRTLSMDVPSAEFTKYAANAMLATRISFMNELANLADSLGVDIERVRQGIGSDLRIGFNFLYSGIGYGGSCFPKDVRALLRTAAGAGQQLQILRSVESANERQKHVLFGKVVAHYGRDLSGKTFALWGLAFKPNTDDMREAPSRVFIRELLLHGAKVRVHDPVAMKEARRVLALDMCDCEDWAERLEFVDLPNEALQDADALAILTEWKVYKSLDFEAVKLHLQDSVIFDGRNLFDPDLVASHGLKYVGIGRRN